MKNLKTSQLLWLVLFSFLTISLTAQSANIIVKQNGVIVTNNGATAADPSAVFDVSSSNKGVIFPKLSTAQRDLISTPAEGLLIYNTTKKVYEFFDGTQWRELAIPIPQTVVNAPSGLVATVTGSTSIDLSWTDNAIDETGFGIQRKLVSESSWTQVATVGADATAYTDDNGGAGLSPATAYSYRIQSLPNTAADGLSAEVNATTLSVFTSTWVTSNTGESGNDQIKLPLESTGTYNFTIDWGDGNTSTITAYNQAEVTHTYAAAGTYTVNIAGTLIGWQFDNVGDKDKITSISNWGDLRLGNNGRYFRGASNLVITATDQLDLTGTTDFSFAFAGCGSLTSFPDMDTGGVTTFYFAWFQCSSLTAFPNLDVSSGTNFDSAWRSCSSLTSFPQFDFQAGEIFDATWLYCSGLQSFPAIQTPNATSMSYAWGGCSGLTSFPLIDTSNVTNFSRAWDGCSGLTSFPQLVTSAGTSFVSTWENCTSLTSFPVLNMGAMTNGTMCFLNTDIGTASYSALLTQINADNSNTNVTFHGGNATYNTSAASDRSALITNGWTITDGGAQQ